MELKFHSPARDVVVPPLMHALTVLPPHYNYTLSQPAPSLATLMHTHPHSSHSHDRLIPKSQSILTVFDDSESSLLCQSPLTHEVLLEYVWLRLPTLIVYILNSQSIRRRGAHICSGWWCGGHTNSIRYSRGFSERRAPQRKIITRKCL